MPLHEFNYRWEFNLESSPEQLWPLVADTNRFNRDTGVPSIQMVQDPQLKNARRHLQLNAFGIPVEWEEQPFEWVRPHRFGVARTYSRGPIAEMKALAELSSASVGGGTKFIYDVWVRPKSLLGFITIPIQIGLVASRRFHQAFKKYDQLALIEALPDAAPSTPALSGAASNRLA